MCVCVCVCRAPSKWMRELEDVRGCTSMTACNFDQHANVDDGSCTEAKRGFDCSGSLFNTHRN